MSDIERDLPTDRDHEGDEGEEVRPRPGDDVVPEDSPAAGVLDPDLDDPPEPSEPG